MGWFSKKEKWAKKIALLTGLSAAVLTACHSDLKKNEGTPEAQVVQAITSRDPDLRTLIAWQKDSITSQQDAVELNRAALLLKQASATSTSISPENKNRIESVIVSTDSVRIYFEVMERYVPATRSFFATVAGMIEKGAPEDAVMQEIQRFLRDKDYNSFLRYYFAKAEEYRKAVHEDFDFTSEFSGKKAVSAADSAVKKNYQRAATFAINFGSNVKMHFLHLKELGFPVATIKISADELVFDRWLNTHNPHRAGAIAWSDQPAWVVLRLPL